MTKYFKEKIDALFIGFCNYGQEDAIAKLAKELNVPVLLWGPRDSMPIPQHRIDQRIHNAVFCDQKFCAVME